MAPHADAGPGQLACPGLRSPGEAILHCIGLVQAALVARTLALMGYYINHMILGLSMIYVNLENPNPTLRSLGQREKIGGLRLLR